MKLPLMTNIHEDTKGLRSLLSFVEKKVAKKATTASKPEVPSTY